MPPKVIAHPGQATYPPRAAPHARPLLAEQQCTEARVETLEVEVFQVVVLMPLPLVGKMLCLMVDVCLCRSKCRVVPMARVWWTCRLLWPLGFQTRIRFAAPASRTSCNPLRVALPNGGNGYTHQGPVWKNTTEGSATKSSEPLNHEHP